MFRKAKQSWTRWFSRMSSEPVSCHMVYHSRTTGCTMQSLPTFIHNRRNFGNEKTHKNSKCPSIVVSHKKTKIPSILRWINGEPFVPRCFEHKPNSTPTPIKWITNQYLLLCTLSAVCTYVCHSQDSIALQIALQSDCHLFYHWRRLCWRRLLSIRSTGRAHCVCSRFSSCSQPTERHRILAHTHSHTETDTE